MKCFDVYEDEEPGWVRIWAETRAKAKYICKKDWNLDDDEWFRLIAKVYKFEGKPQCFGLPDVQACINCPFDNECEKTWLSKHESLGD